MTADALTVFHFLTARRAKAFCSGCVATATRLDANLVAEIVLELRLRDDFSRWIGRCIQCKTYTKTGILYSPPRRPRS